MTWENILKWKYQGPRTEKPRGSTDEKKNAGRLVGQVNSGLNTLKELQDSLDVIYNILEIDGLEKLIHENKISGFSRPDHYIKHIESKVGLLEKNLEDLLEYFKNIHMYGASAQERMEIGQDVTPYQQSAKERGEPYALDRETTGYRDSGKPQIWDDSSELEERYRKKKG
jgi:hypothetical protein